MAELSIAGSPPAWLDAAAVERLHDRIGRALTRARAGGGSVVASITAPVGQDVDPTATVCASRRPGEHWFCLEQPDRDRTALAALGCLQAIECSGEDRFERLAARWRSLSSAALSDGSQETAGAGLVAVGGLAFAPDGGVTPPWAGFAPASLVVPELSLARRGAEVRLTINVAATPDDTAEELAGRALRRVGELRGGPLPLLDPAPTGAYRVSSSMPPSHYEHAVAQAVGRIRAGAVEKVVLAREVQVHAPRSSRSGRRARRPAGGVRRRATCLRSAAATPPSWPPAPSC